MTGLSTRPKWIAAIAVLLIAAWLRVADLATLPPGMSDDESISALDAFHLTQTGRFPFYEDFGRPEPLYIFIEAIFLIGRCGARVVARVLRLRGGTASRRRSGRLAQKVMTDGN